MFKETKDGLILNLRISPNASRSELIIDGDIVKLKITTPPVDGKANKAVVEFLSKHFKVPKTSILIIKGETSREKTLLFKGENLRLEDFVAKL